MKDLLLSKGIKAYQDGKYDEALRFFKKMHSSKEDNLTVEYYLGLVYTKMEQYDEAIRFFKKLIKQKINYELSIRIRKILGYIYVRLQDFTRAKDTFLKVTELNFNDSVAYAALGFIYHKLGNNDTAIKFLKKSIDIDEKNASAHNSLGFIYADMDIRMSDAVKECETALKLLPDYPAYLDSLGWAYFKGGDLKKAKEYLAKALELMPDNDEIRKHFKDVVIKEIAAKREKID